MVGSGKRGPGGRWSRPIGPSEKTSTHTPKICPACGLDRSGQRFVGEICTTCYREGRPFPDQERGVPQATTQEEEPAMPPELPSPESKHSLRRPPRMPTVACPHGCGRTGFPGPMSLHAKVCGKQREGAGTSARPRKTFRRAEKRAKTIDGTSNGNGRCDACLFHGLDSVVARELVADAIRGGMNLETAAGFVRRCLATRA